MDLNIIKFTIIKYIKELLNDYNIPLGYHDFKISNKTGILILTLDALSNDPLLNLISKIEKKYSLFIDEVLKRLYKLDINYDFLINSINFDNVKMILKINMFENYLNLNVIPIELIKLILNFFDDPDDYFNILKIIKINMYPSEIIKQFKILYELDDIIKDGKTITYKKTINTKGEPILITEIYKNDIKAEEIIDDIKDNIYII